MDEMAARKSVYFVSFPEAVKPLLVDVSAQKNIFRLGRDRYTSIF